jgi:hypothetical protein
MVRVTIERDRESGRIVRCSLVGHAQFDEPGKDLVCAGVSTVAFGTVNAVEALVGIELDCVTDEAEGRFEFRTPDVRDSGKAEHLQLLLESMVVMLETIEQSYGQYIQVSNIQVQGR